MKIHREGSRIILIVALVIGFLIAMVHILLQPAVGLQFIMYLALIFLFLSIVLFFRVPNRKAIIDDSKIFSGADGKVVAIEEVMENEYFNEKRRMVSVFMSVFNIHMNFIPVTGKLVYFRHHQGAHFFAYLPKAATENEHTTLVIEHEKFGAILLRQIAGAFARRIVCRHSEGSYLQQGKELGIIKFGSRVDLFLPLNANIHVSLGQHVRGGHTAIASF